MAGEVHDEERRPSRPTTPQRSSRARAARKRGVRPAAHWVAAALVATAILAAGMWVGLGRLTGPASVATPAPDDGATTWYRRASGEPNKLALALTPYLRQASDQPINWYPWSSEPFARAAELDRPILLDIGATWCAACDLMDHQAYQDSEVAALVNGYFVAVRVDRDARPDVDYRYQSMAQALGQASGWPLVLVLIPQGLPYVATGYLPARATEDGPGLKETLEQALAAYRQQRSEVLARAQRVVAAAAESEQQLATTGSSLRGVEPEIQAAISTTFDSINGGWGAGAKTASGPILAYVLESYAATKDPQSLRLATLTLDAIANGSLTDHVMGGLFRMTSDAHWQQPLFEKLAYINAEGILAYARAYELTGEERYRDTLSRLVDFVQTRASDQLRGGFYASQAGHSGRGVDEYYTWTVTEAQAALTPEQAAVVLPHLGIASPPTRPLADDPERSVLYVAKTPEQLAEETGRPVAEVQALLDTGRRRMADARDRGPAPEIDRTLYTNWNARMISAYVAAGRALGREVLTQFAAKTADRFLSEAYSPGQGMGRGLSEWGKLPGHCLEDQILMAQALLDLEQATGQMRYRTAARDLFDAAVRRYAAPSGALVDVADPSDPVSRIPIHVQPILDTATPGTNAMAAIVALQLADRTQEPSYRRTAERILLAFAGSAKNLGPMGATYALALLRFGEAEASPTAP